MSIKLVFQLDNLCTDHWLFAIIIIHLLYFNIQRTEKYSIAMCYRLPATDHFTLLVLGEADSLQWFDFEKVQLLFGWQHLSCSLVLITWVHLNQVKIKWSHQSVLIFYWFNNPQRDKLGAFQWRIKEWRQKLSQIIIQRCCTIFLQIHVMYQSWI